MERRGFVALLAALILFVSAGRARAHHSFAAEFDATRPVTVHGAITRIRLENPHCWFFLDATGTNGSVEQWSFEASTPSSLIRSGVKPGFIKVGDEVTIKGYHARDLSQNVGAARELVTADGRAFAIGPLFSER